MADRQAELRTLADDLRDESRVADAWLAKSFTDRLFVVELESGRDIPDDVRERIQRHGLCGYNEVHDVNVADEAFAGKLARGDRYQFVDVRERGELQSYVVE